MKKFAMKFPFYPSGVSGRILNKNGISLSPLMYIFYVPVLGKKTQ
jgi:hypothetical protein